MSSAGCLFLTVYLQVYSGCRLKKQRRPGQTRRQPQLKQAKNPSQTRNQAWGKRSTKSALRMCSALTFGKSLRLTYGSGQA